jgi:hypothetical protein
MMDKQMTAAQGQYLTDLISKHDIRFDGQLVAKMGRERCDKVVSLIISKAQAMVDAGLTIAQASELIDALVAGPYSWQRPAKAVGVTKDELAAIQRG